MSAAAVRRVGRRRLLVGLALVLLAALLVVSVFPDELLGPWVLARLRARAAEAGYDLEVDSLRGLLARETRLTGVTLTARDPGTSLVSLSAEQAGIVVSAWGLAWGRDDAVSALQGGGLRVELVLDGSATPETGDAAFSLPERLPAVDLDALDLHCRIAGERSLSLRDARVRVGTAPADGAPQDVELDATSCVLKDLPVGTRAGTLSARGTWGGGSLGLESVLVDDAPLLADSRLDLPTSTRADVGWELAATLLEGSLVLRGGMTDGALGTTIEAQDLSIAAVASLLGLAEADGAGPTGRLACDGELTVPALFDPAGDPLERAQGTLHVNARELRVPDAIVRGSFGLADSTRSLGPRALEIDVALQDGALVLSDGALETPGGRLLVRHGRVTLDAATLAEQIVELDGELDFPDLAALGAVLGGPAWGGSLAGSVRLGGPLAELLGDVDLVGDDVMVAGRLLGRVALTARADRRTLEVHTLSVASEAARLVATGRLDLGTAVLEGVVVRGELRGGPRTPLPDVQGSLEIALDAEGPLRDPAVTLEAVGEDLTLAGVALQSVRLRVLHEAGTLLVEALELAGEDGTLSASGVLLHDEGVPRALTVDRLDLAHGASQLSLETPFAATLEGGVLHVPLCALAGSGGRLELSWDAPFPDPTSAPGEARLAARELVLPPLLTAWMPGGWRPRRVDADLLLGPAGAPAGEPDARALTGTLRLAALEFPMPGSAARVRGDVALTLDLTGTRDRPQGRVDVDVTELSVEHGADAQPGAGGLVATLVLRDGIDVQALRLWGPGGMLLQGTGRVDGYGDEAPIDLDLAMAETDIAFLAPLIGDVRRVDGRIGADLRVRGVLGAPVVTGEFTIHDGELRLANAFPPLDDVSARVVLAQDGASIRDLRGDLGGAPFEASGTFVRTAAGPRLELTLAGENLLLARGDGVKLRADADLLISGPPQALTVSGSLGLRSSRLRRHLNPLHMAQGGGPVRQHGLSLFSFTEPPLDAMRFDVRVNAVEPFVLDTNVVSGGLRPELQLTGTGRTPIVIGTVYVEPSRVALPGGTVRVSSGRVLFEAADPFVPRLAIDAGARQRGYDITISVTGPYDAPVVALSSVPPLPGDQLVLLLLTGQPPVNESFGGRGAGADRFAVYIGQDLMARWLGSEAGPGDDSLLDRLELELASDITVSGKESMQVSYRLTDAPREEGPITSLRAERDAYDKVNFGVQFLVRRP
ncbi:MAG: translocation/assembly module TamB domain-containing protein [Planctomycetota bacterium]